MLLISPCLMSCAGAEALNRMQCALIWPTRVTTTGALALIDFSSHKEVSETSGHDIDIVDWDSLDDS